MYIDCSKLRVFISILFVFGHFTHLFTQDENPYHNYILSKAEKQHARFFNTEEYYYSNDTTIDIKFYRLAVVPSLDTNHIIGEVGIRLVSKVDSLESFFLDLAPEIKITDQFPHIEVIQGGRLLKITLETPLAKGDEIYFSLDFEGYPVLLNDIKGLNYRLEDPENPLVVSLSTPYLAHQWWPCKDGPEDKADDGAEIIICIPETTPGGKNLLAVSNGMLDKVEQVRDDLSCFVWKHNYPVVPYYLMVAVAPYVSFIEDYTSITGENFPLEYFVFEDHLDAALEGTAKMNEVMNFFESVFGPYPFLHEKYGMTQLGFYGGIENQTNSIVNRMSADYFMVSVHELAHMWFGDMITCQDWHEGWLNEGFATYAECLWLEFEQGPDAYHQCMAGRKYMDGGTVFLQDDTDPFGIFKTIIYYKGAWILHMLRHVIGDESFFQALKNYAMEPEYQYGNATTDDFRQICEFISGMDLKPYFEQWLFGERYPIYKYNFEQLENGRLMLLIKQAQKATFPESPFFEMPIDIQIHFRDGGDTLIRIQNQAMELSEYFFDIEQEVQNVEIDPFSWILCEKMADETVSTFALANNKNNSFVYPNPVFTGEEIQLEGINQASRIRLANLYGKIIFTSEKTGTISNTLPAPDQPGMYFLIIDCQGKPSLHQSLVCIKR